MSGYASGGCLVGTSQVHRAQPDFVRGATPLRTGQQVERILLRCACMARVIVPLSRERWGGRGRALGPRAASVAGSL
eukprot:6414681-Pyramimonas_sp.AAC.1